jgi:glucose/arabinose dehydrogenase
MKDLRSAHPATGAPADAQLDAVHEPCVPDRSRRCLGQDTLILRRLLGSTRSWRRLGGGRPKFFAAARISGAAFAIAGVPPATAATVPPGFTENAIVSSGLAQPTAIATAPDGRIFVAEQGGQLRVIKNGALVSEPFVTVTVSSAGERGLLGVAFDPDFAANRYVYIYYTATSPTVHNRISRFTAAGDQAEPGSEKVILELDDLSTATNHNGGAIHFGTDGKLYVGVGDNANGANAQFLTTLHGKLLRLNADGTMPSDNPFVSSTTGKYQAIWAVGLRNPFTFAIQPGTGRIFINDVGERTWEEINDGVRGSNYGWPATEGPTSDPAYRSPIYWYGHGTGPETGCAIAGGGFYNPATPQFPIGYAGDYFFADYCSGWIRRLEPASGNAVSAFASGIANPVDLAVAADGSLYYLARGSGATTGSVYRIEYTASRNGRFAADFDGDGKDEIAVWRPTDGVWYVRGQGTVQWGVAGDVPVPDQYDTDPAAEIAVWRPTNGVWYVLGGGAQQWGASTDMPVRADYDGDGDADIAVWRPSNGFWYVRGQTGAQWGLAGDVPIPGDFDADPADDFAVWRPSNGVWYVHGSAPVQWGTSGDIPIVADFNGDGKDDFTVWRPSNGGWYVRGQPGVQWGLAGDVPVAGDYDADPAEDFAVWRPSNGFWYVHGSAPVQWGVAGDVP